MLLKMEINTTRNDRMDTQDGGVGYNNPGNDRMDTQDGGGGIQQSISFEKIKNDKYSTWNVLRS